MSSPINPIDWNPVRLKLGGTMGMEGAGFITEAID